MSIIGERDFSLARAARRMTAFEKAPSNQPLAETDGHDPMPADRNKPTFFSLSWNTRAKIY
jgi:hypothetical protein